MGTGQAWPEGQSIKKLMPDTPNSREGSRNSNGVAAPTAFDSLFERLEKARLNPFIPAFHRKHGARMVTATCPSCGALMKAQEPELALACPKSCTEAEIETALQTQEKQTAISPSGLKAFECSNAADVIELIAAAQRTVPTGDIVDHFVDQAFLYHRIDADTKRWLNLEPSGVWVESNERARKAVREVVRLICEQARVNHEKRWIARREIMYSTRYISEVMSELGKSHNALFVPHSEWDSNPELLGTPRGVWNLRTLEKLSFEDAAAARVTKRVAVSPDTEWNPATGNRWTEFLDEVTLNGAEPNATYKFLKRFLGYLLTGYTREEIFTFLVGPANNGKSCLLELLMYLMGDYGVDLPQTFFKAKRNDPHETVLTLLDGPRAALLDEQKAPRWDIPLLKKVVTGASMRARKMRQDYYPFQSKAKLLIAANDVPAFESDAALEKRIVALDFQFVPDQLDKHLGKKLREIAPQILWEMMHDAREYLRSGLPIDETLKEGRKRLIHRADPVQAFFDERYAVTGSFMDRVAKKKMLADCKLWLENEVSITDMNDRTLTRKLGRILRALSSRGVYEDREGRARIWVGLKASD